MATVSTPIPASRLLDAPLRLRSDAALVSLAQAGHEHAFAVIYDRYRAPLLRYCASIVLNAEDAGDAVQGAMAKAFNAIRGEERDLMLKPWLYRIAHNEAISILRRRRDTSELDERNAPLVAGPEIAAATRERLAELVTDLRSLPERQRSALVMRELSGLEYDDVGVALGISPHAARQAVFEARGALAELGEARTGEGCDRVRRAISDGDRRVLRGRAVGAHLRVCKPCKDFRDGIEARRRDLGLLGPALLGSGATGVVKGALLSAKGSGLISAIAAQLEGLSGGSQAAKVLVAGALVTVGAGATIDGAPSQHRDSARAHVVPVQADTPAPLVAAAPAPASHAARARHEARRATPRHAPAAARTLAEAPVTAPASRRTSVRVKLPADASDPAPAPEAPAPAAPAAPTTPTPVPLARQRLAEQIAKAQEAALAFQTQTVSRVQAQIDGVLARLRDGFRK